VSELEHFHAGMSIDFLDHSFLIWLIFEAGIKVVTKWIEMIILCFKCFKRRKKKKREE
jgi:hypothetical protein